MLITNNFGLLPVKVFFLKLDVFSYIPQNTAITICDMNVTTSVHILGGSIFGGKVKPRLHCIIAITVIDKGMIQIHNSKYNKT